QVRIRTRALKKAHVLVLYQGSTLVLLRSSTSVLFEKAGIRNTMRLTQEWSPGTSGEIRRIFYKGFRITMRDDRKISGSNNGAKLRQYGGTIRSVSVFTA